MHHAAMNTLPALPPPSDSSVVELRQYTLHPGRRDTLVELFDREFVETQEAAGMAVLGQFRDLDDPARFTWLRGFRDMPARRAALEAFYGGPVWRAHRDAANATMVDSDNVLLLRPAWPGAGLSMQGRLRVPPGSAARPTGLLDVGILTLREPATHELLALCRDMLRPLLTDAGAQLTGFYVTEPSANDFPRLPVREGETVLVVLAMFPGVAAFDAFIRSGAWARVAQPQLGPWLARTMENLRLVPTARSALHAGLAPAPLVQRASHASLS
jgi:hypothetical protein